MPKIVGVTTVPGDKSISHRALMLASLAHGTSRVRGFLNGSDCLATLKLMRQLGAHIVEHSPTHIEVTGTPWKQPRDVLDCENSGTTIRLMAGLLAGQNISCTLTGTEQIRRRPMRRVILPLQQMGAHIHGREHDTLAPISIEPALLHGVRHELKVASAQIKSCLLLAGLFANGTTTVMQPGPARDHTERMLKAMGVPITINGNEISVSRFTALNPIDIEVPGDISSAAFIMVAASILPGSDVTIENVGVNPTRDGVLHALISMGAKIELQNIREVCGEPVADIRVQYAQLQGCSFGGDLIVRMIDELPILALAATQAVGTTVIQDAHELRVKETDRIATTAQELQKMGAQIEAIEDGFLIEGPVKLRGARLDSHDDHRLAMMGMIAGLCASGKTEISGAEVSKDSFPGFTDKINMILK